MSPRRPSMLQFSTETDFQGIRYIFNPNRTTLSRVVWLVASLACLVFFTQYTVYKFIAYFSYEFVTEVSTRKIEVVPLPNIGLCTQPIPPWSEATDVWAGMPDIEVIYFCEEAFDFPMSIIKEENTGTRLSIDAGKLDLLLTTLKQARNTAKHTNIPVDVDSGDWSGWGEEASSSQSPKSTTSAESQCDTSVGPESPIDRKVVEETMARFNNSVTVLCNFIMRLERLPPNWSSTHSVYDAGLLPWASKHQLNGARHLAKCEYSRNGRSLIDGCEDLVSNAIILARDERDSYASVVQTCLVLSDVTFQFQHSPYGNEMAVFLSRQLRNVDMWVMLYTGSPDIYSGSVSYMQRLADTWQVEDITTTIDLQRYHRGYALDVPYGDTPCDTPDNRAHVCIDKCLIARLNCTWYFDPLLPYHYHRNSGEPLALCPMEFGHYNACSDACPRSCYTEQHSFFAAYHGPIAAGQQTLIITANHLVMSDVMREVAKHRVDSVLADLGGLMGLFLGASVLSIIHLLEFLTTALVNATTHRAKNTQFHSAGKY